MSLRKFWKEALQWQLSGGLSASLAALGMNNFYAAQAGVTGINDGTRDDAPLLLAAYTAAVAAGAKALILPVGEIYLSSYVLDTANSSYPGSYVVRVAADDFSIIVPAGCRINCSGITGATDSAAQNHIDIFQFTGNRSGITGGGLFYHSVSGYTGSANTTQRNCIHAVHLTAGSDKCFMRNLKARGLCGPSYGVFDNSSAFVGFQENLHVEDCGIGVNQSSGQSTTGGTQKNIDVIGALYIGVASAGRRMEYANITVHSSGVSAITGWCGINIAGWADASVGSTFKVRGPASGTGIGVQIGQTAQSQTGRVVLTTLDIEDCWTGLIFLGAQNIPSVSNFSIRNCTNGVDKQTWNGRACSDTILKNGKIIGGGDGLRINGGATTDTTNGRYICDGVDITTAGSVVASTVAVVKSAVNCTPPLTGVSGANLPRPTLTATDKGCAYYDTALAQPRYVYYSGTSTTWYDGAGATV